MNIKQVIFKFIPERVYGKYKIIKGRLKNRKIILQTHNHYFHVVENIKERNIKKIRFASYIVFDSCYGASNIVELMLQQPSLYDVKFVIIPDVVRGEKHLVTQYESTKSFFVKKYGSDKVLDGYDISTKSFIDHSDKFDVIYLSNIYDEMVNRIHGVKYLSRKNVLPIYLSYGCMTDRYGYYNVMPLLETSLFWRVFADEKYIFSYYKKYQLYKGKNVLLSGYSKMDSLAKIETVITNRKKILIAPHHTVNNSHLPLSNFLDYSEFILELPKLYPKVDFIFRPHPLLFTNLVTEKIWSEKQVDSYLGKIKEAGIEYSFGGDYLNVFVKSDAIIHDCISFIAEYLYTKKPCCFAAKKNQQKYFSSLGKACLKNYYKAFNKEEISLFIQNVVLDGNDPLRNQREVFMEKELATYYPNSSENVLNEIRSICI